jgi:hypothetical protein
MRISTTRRILMSSLPAALIGICTLVGTATEARAQPQRQQDQLRMPSPSKEEDPSFLAQIFVLLVIAGAAIGANVIPSKRGHQD